MVKSAGRAFVALRRLTQSTDALGKLTRQAYDADGRLIRASAQVGTQWLVSCSSYSVSGKLLKAWGPAQTAADTACPAAAAPVPVTDQVTTTVNLTYDGQDLLAEYDAAGALQRR